MTSRFRVACVTSPVLFDHNLCRSVIGAAQLFRAQSVINPALQQYLPDFPYKLLFRGAQNFSIWQYGVI